MSNNKDIDLIKDQEKEKVLENSNVLLISDNEKDYDELIKYGFKNVTWFPSIIRADNYFAEHPEMFDKFHVVIDNKLSHDVRYHYFPLSICNWISSLNRRNVIAVKLDNYDMAETKATINYSYDKIEKSGYDKIFDAIVSKVIDCEVLKQGDFVEPFVIEDFVKKDRLPLPKKKEDLKILYLNSAFDTKNRYSEYVSTLAKKLGLNVTFLEDNNNTLGWGNADCLGVNRQLGDFDIIIGSYVSGDLINFSHESTEQCKDTGRDLTLLMVYNCNNYFMPLNEIKLKYCFGGRLAPDTEKKFIIFNRLCKSFDFTYDENSADGYNSLLSDMLCIIGSAVNLYNDALKHNQKSPITDLSDGDIPLKSIEDYICEFEEYDKKQQNIIDKINEIKFIISEYFPRRKKLATKLPDDLRIEGNSKFVGITKYSSGRPIYALNIDPNLNPYDYTSARFSIQFFTPEGEKAELEQLYISAYEPSPSQRQLNVIDSISDSVITSVKPLINHPEQSDSQGSKPKSRGQYQRYPKE